MKYMMVLHSTICKGKFWIQMVNSFLRLYLCGVDSDFRHLASLKSIYGYQLLVNLLGRKEGEHSLSTAYKVIHINQST